MRIFALGFGFDLSEFDIWWAAERKNREHARHGVLHAYMIEEKADTLRSSMMRAMGIDEVFFRVRDKQYASNYETAVEDIKASLQ